MSVIPVRTAADPKAERGIVIVREKTLDFWVLAIAAIFWVIVLAADRDERPFICVGGFAAAVAWLLLYRADREDARRSHELELEREKTRQLQLQLVRDEALWQRALEEQASGRR
jgi:hypothetical protein